MYRLQRELTFCYGHRLVGYAGKCAHLHGHNARVILTLEAPALDAQGMVIDFQEVRERAGAWIDRVLDHRLILQDTDPLVPVLRTANEEFVAVPFPPTAEHLARHLCEESRRLGLPVVQVDFWETPACCATYRVE